MTATATATKQRKQCKVAVYHSDVPRYTGGRPKFKTHYTKEQCARPADETGRCWQHRDQPWLDECEWAKEFMDQ